jgi:hypothetical protein
MVRVGCLLLGCLIGSTALSQTTERQRELAARRARLERLIAIEDRIAATAPKRRDSPLRAENISDLEVAEIQRAAGKIYPGAVFNISGVVTGCACEDGPACTDQVWILASRSGRTIGLLLSKIDGHWTIGPVQQWWLEDEQLGTRRHENVSRSGYFTFGDEHKEKFPICAAEQTSERKREGPSKR